MERKKLINLGRNLRNLSIVIACLVTCLVALSGCISRSASVKGTILLSSGEPLAKKEVILIPLSEGDKVKVFNFGRTREVPLSELGKNLKILKGDKIMFETGRNRMAKWKAKTDDAGNFLITNIAPGKYVLFRLVAGTVIRIGTKEGHILVEAKEGEAGEVKDMGTIILLASNEKIPENL